MTTTAPTLFDGRPEFAEYKPEPGATLDERARAFAAENPWVLDALIRLCDQAHQAGRKRVGIKHLVEVLRWEHGRATEGDEWRMNNSYVSRLARMVIEARPDLADLIETRELRA